MRDGKVNVLILGSGAREHALARACAKSAMIGNLFVAPGNPGCATIARTVPLSLADHATVTALCRTEAINLVVVGPEGPLVSGVANDLLSAGVLCFGPTREAARLEGSKGYAKDFCREFGIPTGDYRRFREPDEAKAYIRKRGTPIVIKADGLAAGKGVVVAKTLAEAEVAVDALLSGVFGSAGGEIVIEEFLEGEEVSFFALCDGETAVPFGSAQDHKRVGEGDTGPNTGGMGAYSPPPVMTTELSQRIMHEIITPTLHGMNKRKSPYRGALFAGLMIDKAGPKVIEFNVRFGDPEAEVILPRLEDDLLPLLVACANGALRGAAPKFRSDAALVVVMAARGYPGESLRGSRIRGIEDAEAVPGVRVLHGGTREIDRAIIADGGRVLAITALGGSVGEAQRRAYEAVDRINWPEGFCRRDIGWRAISRASKR
jgi:phosphoribosylamine--glycine ligase